MPGLSNLRLIFSSPPSFSSLSLHPFFRFSFSPSSLKPRPYSTLTVHSYSRRRGRRNGGGGVLPQRRRSSNIREEGGGVLPQRRRNSNIREEGGGDRSPEMDEGFNKRRAEGRDKPSKPKILQLKNRRLNPVSTLCYVQILGTGMDTQDTSPSVLLFFDKQRFIFNAGEGLQRFCTEHKIKLSKIDHMFLTRVCSETAGGLPGLLLTLAGMGDEGMSVNIWGPSDIKYLFDAMRSFIPNAAMVHTHSFGATQEFDGDALSRTEPGKFLDPVVIIDDEVVRISAISLRPSYKVSGGAVDISNNSNLSSLFRGSNNQMLGHPLSCSQISDENTVSSVKPGDISVIYACELREIMGKFDPDKAASLGLRPGPKYRELQLGKSVMSDRFNTMVHPSDVLGPSIPGPVILLVDCPTPFHMMELLSTQSLDRYYVDCIDHPGDAVKAVNCIIHLGPAFVTKNSDYQEWMKRFGGAQHIMAGHEMKNMEVPILKSSARISSRLNFLCPQLFPARGFWPVQHNNFPMKPNGSREDLSSTICESVSAENLLKFHLRPFAQLGLDHSAIPSTLDHQEIINDLLSEIPEIIDVAKRVQEFWQSPIEVKSVAAKGGNQEMVEEPWLEGASVIPDAKKKGNYSEVDSYKKVDPYPNSFHKEIRPNYDIPSCLENITREDMEITLLGTGSSQPSKYRNVSSIFVNLFSKGGLLLDCGEGTLAQLKRRFGVEGADSIVKGLSCIWISHIHADHHTGIARVLALRSQLLKGVPHEPLIVVGPRPLKRFLDAYSRLEDIDMQFLDCSHTTEASHNTLLFSNDQDNATDKDHRAGGIESDYTPQNLGTTLFALGSKMQSHWKRPGSPVDTTTVLPILLRLKEVLCEAGLEALYSVPVVHCPQAFGVVLKAAARINAVGKSIPGWKLVYSGDTRPCQSLIDASRDATVLIHESTFEDSMRDEAVARNHSTTSEAIDVGASADVYRTILTHFSQRYPKIPVFDEAHMRQTCIAFDLMSINAADLPMLPEVLPYLKLIFRNEMVVDETDEALEPVSVTV